MTPEPDPPEPPVPTEELSVNTANAQGVIYLNPYDNTQPDIQTYSTFDYAEVAYTVAKNGQCYLAIPRSANEGDDVRLGFYKPSSKLLWFNEKVYNVDTSGNVTGLTSSSNTDKPTLSPENAELQAKFQNNSATVELSEVVR